MGDNGIQRGGFGVSPRKQGQAPPAKRAVKVKKPPKAVASKPVVKKTTSDKTRKQLAKQQALNRRMREMERRRKPGNVGCVVTAFTVGVGLVGAVGTLRGWA